MAKKPELDETTRRIAERMLKTPPKPHKPIGKRKRSPAKRKAKASR